MKKRFLFEDSMFHISIENCQLPNLISEKLIDNFMSFTVPIYWGAPNLGDIFNTDGVITFNDKDELNYILNNLTENDYIKRIPYLEENYKISYENYAFFFDRINNIIMSL